MASGIGHTVAMMAMNMLDHLQPVEGMGPVGEIRIVPDPETFVALPYAPGAGAMVSDLVQQDGGRGTHARGHSSSRAIAELASDGYALRAAFEPEFTLGQREPDPDGGPDRLVPADDSLLLLLHRLSAGARLHHRPGPGTGGTAAGGRALLP